MVTEAPPRVALTNVHCNGRLPYNRPCLKLLFKAHPGDFNIYFEIKCPKCGSIAKFGPLT